MTAAVPAGTDVAVSPASLTFTAGDWSEPQAVTVSAAEDADAAADAAVTVSHEVSGYGAVTTAAAVTVTVQENDTAGVAVSPTALRVPEGGSGSYTVVLVTRPAGTVTVTATVPAGTDVAVSPASLTFTAGDWSEPQAVTVSAAEDADAAADAVVTVSHAVSGYGAVTTAPAVQVTIAENDTAVVPRAVTVDIRAADATVSFPTNAKFTVALEFTAPVTGLALAEIEVSNGVAAQLAGGGASYTVAVTPVADFKGVTTVAISAGAVQDGAGNGNAAASAEFAVDTRSPTVRSGATAPVDTGAGTTSGGVEYPQQSGSRTSARTDNNPATGQIDIVGTRQVDYMLLARLREFADPDGLPSTINWVHIYEQPWWDPTPLSVQWIANDGTSDREIARATHVLYQLTDAEAGKRIKVRVSFTDESGFEETITSELTAVIAAATDGSASYGDLRLMDGSAKYGRLEIHDGSRWGTVCADGFGYEAQAVACRQLGYPSAVGTTFPYNYGYDNGNPGPGYFDPGPGYPIFLDDTECTGVESRLLDCEHRSFGSHSCGRGINVILQCSSAALAAPSFTSSATFSVRENETAVGTVTTASVSGPPVSYAIADGDDGALFAIDQRTGELSFTSGRDFENPTDAAVPDPNDPLSDVEYNPSSDNVYVVVVAAGRGYGDGRVTAEQTVSVTVTDVDEPPPAPVAVTVAVESPTSLRVSWQAPDNSGRPAITDYDVRYRVAGSDTFSDAEHEGTGLSTTLTNLTANTTYEVQVRASNDEGAGPWSPAVRRTTGANQLPSGAPAITGTAQVGQTLSADTSSIVDRDGPASPSFSYQWLADDEEIVGATGATYTLTAAEQGKRITVRVSYTDGAGTEETLTSAATAAVVGADTQTEPEVQVLVFFDAARYTAVEGGAAAVVTVRLSTDPEREVTIPLTAAPGGGATAADYTVPEQVSFGSEETLQRLTVTATDDGVDDDGETVALGFGELPRGVLDTTPRTATVSIADDDTAGVAVSAGALSVPEGGRGSYAVALESEPEGTVTVTAAVPGGTDVTVSPQRLTFTADTWSTAQEVTVRAAEDADADADAVVRVSHAVSGYGAVSTAAAVRVTILENDTAGVAVSAGELSVPEGGRGSYTVVLESEPEGTVTVTASVLGGTDVAVSPQRLTFTADTWGEPQEVTVQAAEDADAVADAVVRVSHVVSGYGAVSTAAAVRVTILENDTAGVAVSAGELSVPEGGRRSYTVVLESEPAATVTVAASVPAGTDVTVSPESLTFTADDWSTAQAVTVRAAEDADAVADAVVTVSHAVSGYGAVSAAADVLVTVQENDTAGVAVSPTGLTVLEGGRGSYAVVLESEPAGTVTVAAGVPAGTDVTVSPESLTFTADDWSEPQAVEVRAAEDADAVADAVVRVSHAVSGYGAVSAAADVAVTVQENDTAGVVVTPTALTVPEGGSGSYTVALVTQPDAAVTVTASVPEGTDVEVSPQRLTFTADTWSEPQEVTVRAAEDADADVEVEVTVSHAVNGYGAVSVAAAVAVTVQELDTAGVAVSPTGLTVPEGGSGSYTVVLESEPAATVTVAATVPAGTDVTVSPESLTFTADDWSSPQTVTVSAAEDADAVADAVVTVRHEVSGYGAVSAAADVAVTVQENDTAGVVVTPTAFTVPEGGRGSYTVVLVTQPDAAVTVTAAVPEGTDVAVSPESLTFTADDWSSPQTVTVRAAEDADAVADAVVTVRHEVSGYGAVSAAADVAVTVQENDTAGVVVTPTALTVPEGGRGSYTVALVTQPDGTVTVTATVPAGTDVAVSPASLTFTADDWSEPQAVTVSAAEDADAEVEAVVTVSHAVSGYGAVSTAAAVQVTIAENDTAVVPRAVTVHIRAADATLSFPTNAKFTVALEFTAPVTGLALEEIEVSNGVAARLSGGGASYTVEVTPPADFEGSLTVALAAGAAQDADGNGNAAASAEFAVDTRAPTVRSATTAPVDTGAGTTSGGVEYPQQSGSRTSAAGAVGSERSEAASEGYERVHRELLGPAGAALSAGTLAAVGDRIEAVATGAAQHGRLSLAGRQVAPALDGGAGREWTEPAVEPVAARRISVQELVGGGGFVVPLGAGAAAAQRSGGGTVALWGSGDYGRLADAGGAVEWSGDLLGVHVGADLRVVPELLAGVALSWSQGRFDYTERKQPGAGDGEYAIEVVSVHPYASWWLPGLGLWATAGYGWGEVAIAAEADAEAEAERTSETRLLTSTVAGSGRLLSTDGGVIAGGTTELRLKAQGTVVRIELQGNGVIEPLALDTRRLRVLLEGSHAQRAEWGRLTPVLEVGLRYDEGDGAAGAGLELGGELRYEHPGLGLTVAGQGRVLTAHEAAYEEWGVGGLLRLELGAGGEGLRLSVEPGWGVTASGTRELWEHGVPEQAPAALAAGSTAAGGRLEAELGYGLPAFDGRGLLTPYGGLTLGADERRDYRAGARLELEAFELRLEGTRRESAGGGADHELTLRGGLRL